MGNDNAVMNLPPGYTLEASSQPTPAPSQPTQQGAVPGLPEGYTLENPDGTTPLTDEQAAYRKATAAGPNVPAGAAEKAMGAEWGDNAAQAKQALKVTGEAALQTAGGVVGASGVGALADAATSAFEPVTAKVIEYLPHLAKIVKAGRDLGLTGIGLKEAHDLYKVFSSDK